jgi:uncharacterized protein (TIGR02594 family)
VQITAHELASRFIGVGEVPGEEDNPFVMSMLKLDARWPEHDEVPWCSAFVNYVAWLLHIQRSKSLRARSWLQVGRSLGATARISHGDPPHKVGWDVVVMKRGGDNEPGPEVIEAKGHVGFFCGYAVGTPKERVADDRWSDTPLYVEVLGGNQGNKVSIARYPVERILDVRRIYEGE